MWGEVGNETEVGLRAPLCKVNEIGSDREPWEVFEQDYTGQVFVSERLLEVLAWSPGSREERGN